MIFFKFNVFRKAILEDHGISRREIPMHQHRYRETTLISDAILIVCGVNAWNLVVEE